jgi:iron(III) transport system substrate-binding protein
LNKLTMFAAGLGLLLAACGGSAASQTADTSAKVPQYSGADRQQVLEAGAKKEGAMTLYTSTVPTVMNPLVDGFTAKYPFIKVDQYRADNTEIVQRVSQETQAKKYTMDTLETTTDGMIPFLQEGLLQPFTSPELAAYPKDAVEPKGNWGPVRASFIGLGYNTKLVAKDQAPKTLDDLLDPKWKGKMSIAGSSTGVRFVGALLNSKGDDFVRKLGEQQIKVQNVSGRALADLVIAGEVPLSPTIFNSHVADSKQKGAPIEWVPLEPVVVNAGGVALSAHPVHPYASMLFLDFMLSEQGQKIYIEHGYDSPRQGMSTGIGSDFKKVYLETVAPNYVDSFAKWQQLMRSTFNG